ncbi:Fur family transcriptional regulator, ferric uptake regulator [Humidesulfovibrio mexicanus]|uniref:Fur family transcriptional regulator, ferric uptake regulator n=1 Tax=Humidesulfovibrio mexicanus TaxID=147047 RepID=A0A238Z8H9_9BACT|nr:Fur family transcriptional regulator [Humidesulfovibrio mexicanus]SNR79379.1 Fur family transcriptional regulator, ferric uptake regulator [Humidesulfovibrio mexicanus]
MDAQELLSRAGLAATDKRLLVVQAMAEAGRPVTPQELLAGLGAGLNRVTLYRILDLLVEHELATRHNAGERAFRYCLRTGPAGHAHFTCSVCGQTRCIDSRYLAEGLEALLARLPMRVDSVDIRLLGVCGDCQPN